MFGNPLPCANAAGELSSCPKFKLGKLKPWPLPPPPPPAAAPKVLPLPLLPDASEPSVWPLLENNALCFIGPAAASAAAERIAERRALGFPAPRIVSTTFEPLRMRKVGILKKQDGAKSSNQLLENRCSTYTRTRGPKKKTETYAETP